MVIPFASLPVSPWRNGRGRKADIAAGPGWLLGFAFLDQDADFSDYAGYDRTITLVEGAGFVLEPLAAGGAPIVVDRPHNPARFDGGWPCRCRLLGGPCVVLNAISERARGSHTVAVQDAAPPPDGTGHAVLLAGTASLGGTGLAPRDAVALPAPLVTGPGAILAIARFDPRAG